VTRRRRTQPDQGRTPDPFAALGLPASASVAEIEQVRRTLAKGLHPDIGGSLSEMQRINAAADAAVRARMGRPAPGTQVRTPPSPPPPAPAPAQPSRLAHDHPSFTIEALPAEAFEALVIVASVLGDLVDDDPPYRLDVLLRAPFDCWCRVEVMPEAGASSVSLTVAGAPGAGPPELDAVRDAWIVELNQLDWSGPESLQRP
jgi:hypothetical protein